MNNIYAKTVHKENSTPHDSHPIASSKGVGLKAPLMGSEVEPRKL